MIEARLADLEAEARQLERALSHLRDEDGNRPRRRRRSRIVEASRSPGEGRRKPSRRKAGKRARRGQRRDELLAAIEANPGARPSELAATIGIRPTQVSVLIAKARGEKLIVRSGEGYALKS
jgi:hypothetical protein